MAYVQCMSQALASSFSNWLAIGQCERELAGEFHFIKICIHITDSSFKLLLVSITGCAMASGNYLYMNDDSFQLIPSSCRTASITSLTMPKCAGFDMFRSMKNPTIGQQLADRVDLYKTINSALLSVRVCSHGRPILP